MRSMRALVQEFNVYRWAGRMLIDAARVRQRRRLAARVGGRGSLDPTVPLRLTGTDGP